MLFRSEYDEVVPDVDADPARFPVVHFDLAPGDCTVHHANTLHASGGNRTPDRMRRAVILRYAGEDARYTVHQQALKTADPGLKVGDPLGGEHYPQVWPRDG